MNQGSGGSPLRLAPILPLVLALLAGCGRAAPPTPDVAPGTGPATRAAAQAKRGTTLTGSHGGRAYHLFVPAGLKGPRPLVVMLHGCTQDPADFAAGTRMNAIAARERFYVLYPQQTRDDQVKACWPFYEPLHQVRGLGAAHDIVGMVEKVRRSHDVDANAIHAAGLSAGGAYTAVLAALYPDVFASVGVHSGLAFGVATTVAAAKLAMKVGGPPPEITGGLAYLAMGTRRRVVPTLVFQGDADDVVAPVNGEQVTTQALVMNDWASDGLRNGDVDTRPDGTEAGRVAGGHRFTRTWFHDDAGHVVVERVAVAGMGHAWSGGDARGTYTDPLGPDASAMMWAFFKAHRR
jgi:poly(hydroxyalkanoate) depolymerase family esterase